MSAPKCHYCDHEGHTNDHIIPRALGGKSHSWNIVDCCSVCNNAKGDMSYEEFTGKSELPQKCIDAGFPTTQSFRIFMRQLRSFLAGGIRLDQNLLPPASRKKRNITSTGHPAYVSPCLHEPPCRGQDGCVQRRRDAAELTFKRKQ